jgi:shikimate kinase
MKLQPAQNIFLVGMPAVGKTTLGKQIAKKLKYNFIDLDTYIELQEGRTIAQLFEQIGESAFRELEAKTIRNTASEISTVISTGGGAAEYHDNMEWMNKHGMTIYLEAEVSFILQRVMQSTHTRPLFKGLDETETLLKLKDLMNKRKQYYTTAKHIIRVPLKSVEILVNTIL